MIAKICIKCERQHTGSNGSYCPSCFSENQRARYAQNRSREIKRVREYAARNPGYAARQMANSRERNPEHFRKYLRDYRANNPERARTYDANKRAKRRLALSGGGVSKLEWLAILRNFGEFCFYCEDYISPLTMDHFIPITRGGKHKPSNIRPSCAPCNSSKGNKMPWAFHGRRRA